VVWARERDIRFQFGCDFFMLCKILSVIELHGETLVDMRFQLRRYGRRRTLGMFARHLGCQDITRLSLSQRDKCATMIFADDHMAFPVADTYLSIHNLWTLVNADPILDHTTALLPAGITLASLLLATQVPPQIATTALVSVDVQADGFVLSRELSSKASRSAV